MGFTSHMRQNLSQKYTAWLLVACFFVSGIIDVAAFTTWGVFANLQTGNTITLAARITGEPATQHKYHWLKNLTAIASFNLGSFIFP